MKKQTVKKLLALALSLALVAVCFLNSSALSAQAAVMGADVEYVSYTGAEMASLIGKTAPVKQGYLFAGWFTDNTGEAPITTGEGAPANVYAKFVKANLRGVAMQARWDMSEDAQSTDLRVISLVHGTFYQAVGYNIYVRTVKADGTLSNERVLCEYDPETKTSPSQSTTLYSGLRVYTDGTVENSSVAGTNDVFGRDEGWYFTTMRINKIPSSMWDNNIIVSQPYWITADGTYVPGPKEYNRANDGLNEIVNVTVNILGAEAIATGVVEITYPEGFDFVDYDYGRVFEDMFYLTNDQATNTLRTAGNTNRYRNVLNPNDAYVNLRFRTNSSYVAGAGQSVFTVTSDFSAYNSVNDEIVGELVGVTANALDVKY